MCYSVQKMKPNYNRATQYNLKYEEYLREYERRYPSYGSEKGFAHKTDCGELGGKGCMCWVCKSIEWGLHIVPETEEDSGSNFIFNSDGSIDVIKNHGENSVIKTVVIALFILWLLVKFNDGLNEEYYKNNEMYKLAEPSTEKHWLYK